MISPRASRSKRAGSLHAGAKMEAMNIRPTGSENEQTQPAPWGVKEALSWELHAAHRAVHIPVNHPGKRAANEPSPIGDCRRASRSKTSSPRETNSSRAIL
jgi:hypothetical protein